MVNHACNLRCTYCYTGAKFNRPMPDTIGRRAIERALASVRNGGDLEVGFFGGEPLIEAPAILRWLGFARAEAFKRGIKVRASLTTNGTLQSPAAWEVMLADDVELSVSCDGFQAEHDRHRVFPDGRGSFTLVEDTLHRLQDAGKEFRVISVVRPDNLADVPAALEYFQGHGVPMVNLSLDLWCDWPPAAVTELEQVIARCADIWRSALPDFSVSWFDDKAARLARAPVLQATSRCGFGNGEIAVAPSGRLYPCERLIGEDREEQPMRLAGHVTDGDDFLSPQTFAGRHDDPCGSCKIQSLCSTTCRCSNYVRTGDVSRPDGLLCRVDKACFRETVRVLTGQAPVSTATKPANGGMSYVQPQC